jgi:site-specific DNA-methyltransferase (cytosine-N4-specific)
MRAAAPKIELDLDRFTKNNYHVHGLHSYPAKFIPQIPAEVISKLTAHGDWVLDPFCGSGTSLVEAVMSGRNAIGIDANPLASLIAKVKVTPLTKLQLNTIEQFVDELSLKLTSAPKAARQRFDRIDFWFTEVVQCELAATLAAIEQVRDDAVQAFLKVVFSSIVVRVSNQESDTRYKSVNKGIAAGDVEKIFKKRAVEMRKRCAEFSASMKGQDALAYVIYGNSTNVVMPRKDLSLVVTSPPYMNSYDYYLYHRHRMLWLGMDAAAAQLDEIGSRNWHNDKGMGLEDYVTRIRQVVSITSAALKARGYYAVVIGDSILRGELIKMDAVYDEMFADLGLTKVQQVTFAQRKYTRSFMHSYRTLHKDSYLLIYQVKGLPSP